MVEINEMRIFSSQNVDEIFEIERCEKKPYIGYFYVLEYSDSVVKIGKTGNPSQRLNTLKRDAENYGSWNLGLFALSRPHTNYSTNETILHEYFAQRRRYGSELFDIQFMSAVKSIPHFIRYEDNSEERVKKDKEFTASLIKYTSGNYNDRIKNSNENIAHVPEVDLGKLSEVIEITRKYILAAGGTPEDVLQATIEIQWVFGIHNPILDRRHKSFGGEQA